MYHDEFAQRSVRSHDEAAGALSGIAIQVGGGVSAAVASTIALPDLPILLSLGGLLPMLACCLEILADRGREARVALMARAEAWMAGRPRRPVPAITDMPIAALRGPRLAPARSRAVRAGFDRSRRLG